MSFTALILVTISAILHLGWNVAAKKSQNKLAFIWLIGILPALIGALIVVLQFETIVSQANFRWLLYSVLAHGLYAFLLCQAYRMSDLSYVYPLSRGMGIFFITVFAVVFLSESPNLLGWFGILIILVGSLIEPLSNFGVFGNSRGKKIHASAFLITLLTGVGIALYLVVDKVTLRYLDPKLLVPILFIGTHFTLSPLALKEGAWKEEWKLNRRLIVMASFLMIVSVMTFFLALEIAPAVYVGASRSIGIVLSGVVGIFFLGEAVSRTRWFSIILISLGLIVIGVFGK